MLELLWFVGYCGEFPSQLASRVGGHPEWNRHVKYRAIKDGLVTVSRDKDRQRIIRSLHLTQEGLDYIGERDPVALSYVLKPPDDPPPRKSFALTRSPSPSLWHTMQGPQSFLRTSRAS